MITTLKYPDNIEEDAFSTRRVVFMAMPGELKEASKNWYTGTKNADTAKSAKENQPQVKCVITLPLPGKLQDSQSHTWKEESITALTAKVVSGSLTSVVDSIAKKSKIKLPDISTLSDIHSAANSLASQTMGIRKRIINPGLFQTYEGSGLRSFSFSFDFIPETKNEAKNIIDIISAFKTYSSPSTDNAKTTLLSPYMWQIAITNGVVNKLLSLNTCVCTSVSVDYGTDKFDIMEDGLPKTMSLSLNFSETTLNYAENYNSGLETQNNTNSVLAKGNTGFENSLKSGGNVLDIEGNMLDESGISNNTVVSAKDVVSGWWSGMIDGVNEITGSI